MASQIPSQNQNQNQNQGQYSGSEHNPSSSRTSTREGASLRQTCVQQNPSTQMSQAQSNQNTSASSQQYPNIDRDCITLRLITQRNAAIAQREYYIGHGKNLKNCMDTTYRYCGAQEQSNYSPDATLTHLKDWGECLSELWPGTVRNMVSKINTNTPYVSDNIMVPLKTDQGDSFVELTLTLHYPDQPDMETLRSENARLKEENARLNEAARKPTSSYSSQNQNNQSENREFDSIFDMVNKDTENYNVQTDNQTLNYEPKDLYSASNTGAQDAADFWKKWPKPATHSSHISGSDLEPPAKRKRDDTPASEGASTATNTTRPTDQKEYFNL